MSKISYDAIIIGAGFSGLYQLYKLRDKLNGFRTRVYNGEDFKMLAALYSDDDPDDSDDDSDDDPDDDSDDFKATIVTKNKSTSEFFRILVRKSYISYIITLSINKRSMSGKI